MVTGFNRPDAAVLVFLMIFTLLVAPSLYAKDSLVDRGNRMLKKAEYKKAMTFFKAAINKDGSNQAAWDGYQKATLAQQNANKDKLHIDNIPRGPEEVPQTPVSEEKSGTQIAVEDLMAQEKTAAKSNQVLRTNSIASFSSERTNPWKGLSVFNVVDPTLLHSPSLAKNRFEAEKKGKNLALFGRNSGIFFN